MAINERVHILRESIVKITQILAGKQVQVTQRGVSAFVKPDANGKPVLVNLPYMPDNADDALIDAIQGFLDHEVAHILFTDFKAANKVDRKNGGTFWNVLEDTRIEREMAARFRGSAENLQRTGQFFLDKYVTPKLNEAMAKGDMDTVRGILSVPLVRAMAGQPAFKHFMSDKMHHVQELYDKVKHLEPRIAACKSTSDAYEISKEMVACVRDGKAPAPGPADPASAPPIPMPVAGGGKGKKDPTAPKAPAAAKAAPAGDPDEEEPAPAPAAGKDEEEAAPAPSTDPDEEATPAPATDPDEEEDPADPADSDEEEDPEEEEELPEDEDDLDDDELDNLDDGDDAPNFTENDEEDAGGSLEEAEPSDPAAPDEGGAVDPSKGSAATWEAIDKENANDFDSSVSTAITQGAVEAATDAEYLIYTKDKDVIEPLKVGSGFKPEMLTELQDKVDHMVGPLQKDLERAIAARSLSHWSPGQRSGRLHAANLSRLALNDSRVFRRKEEATSKDVAVELLLDISGSMMGSKLHTASQTAYALASTLERIGIKCEAICFTTGEACDDYAIMRAEADKLGRHYSRYEALYMPILKGFDERMSTEIKNRFGWLPNSSIPRNNVDGECVEIAARRLMARREKGKVLIVLSDGAPNASGHTRTLGPHLKRVVSNVTRAGVKVVGIGIEDDAVREFYPKHLILQNVAELPGVVMKELRQLIIG